MGYAIAAELHERGAEVYLVSGKTALTPPDGVQTIDVLTADEMYQAATQIFERCDGAVMCAAVADYTPKTAETHKIKKDSSETWSLELAPTQDIAAAIGANKGNRLLVGFALETDNEQVNALSKLEKKNMDFIVLNSLKDKGAGFGTKTNRITILRKDGTQTEFGLKSKTEVAADIVDEMEAFWGTDKS